MGVNTMHKRKRQAGFTLIEVLLAVVMVGVGFLAVAIQMKTLKATLSETSRLMAMDSFERYIGDYLRSKDIISYSVKMSGDPGLARCFAGKGCANGRTREFDVYLPGEKKPITGPKVLYDDDGVPCEMSQAKKGAKACGSFSLMTSIQTNCFRTANCDNPEIVLLKAEFRRVGDKKSQRTFVREMERHSGGRFANQVIQCYENGAILKGVGVLGEALCTPRSKIVYIDGDKARRGDVVAKHKDCLEETGDDQSFVKGINTDGTVTCSKKFW